MHKKRFMETVKKHELDLVLLFGSYADKSSNKESDIDIAYFSRKNLSPEERFDQMIRINADLINVFGNDKIDTVNLRKANPLLLKKILDNHQILYQRSNLVFSKLEALTLKKYEEAKVLFDMRSKYLEDIYLK